MQDNLLDAILVTYIEPDDILETFIAMKKRRPEKKNSIVPYMNYY